MADIPDAPASPSPSLPLAPITPDRANQKRDARNLFPSPRGSEGRESSVHEKISQFNSLANQTKTLERKTADAALKRAMLGREEAEGEARRYKDECKVLRVQLEKGKEREQRVSERLETVMEQYGRAKETYAHTKAAWEKEIKLARKKTFKNESQIIKLQEELKAAREGWRAASDNIDAEKLRSKAREEEAFQARYQMVSMEEQLTEAHEKIKLLEQERDAFKTLAKEEEVARIAAEGRIPLPKNDAAQDEFSSPKKRPRFSLSTVDIVSSAATEEEIEQLSLELSWERQRADRAYEMVDFMQAECENRCCSYAKARKRHSMASPRQSLASNRPSILSPRRRLMAPAEIADASDLVILRDSRESLSDRKPSLKSSQLSSPASDDVAKKPESLKRSREERRSTIFCPREGIFRTVSQEEAEEVEARREKEEPQHEDSEASPNEPPTPVDAPLRFSRTPSLDPPAFAVLAQERMSLASLLNAPHGGADGEVHTAPLPSIPTMPDTPARPESRASRSPSPTPDNTVRPHTAAAFYTKTTTTSVPLRDDKPRPVPRYERARTPSGESHMSFDVNNPAMTPTMTREEALARIRERRGRAKSIAQGTATPRKKMIEGAGERRDVSAPAGQAVPKAKV
ncbi:PAP2 superfamily protein [Colletotrichum asianum]